MSVLARSIDNAEQQLLNNPVDSSDSIAILYTGNWNDAVPRQLVISSDLSPTDKITWQVIRLTISDPNNLGSLASRSDLAQLVNCSEPTVSKSKISLRLSRWLTYCRSVRRQGRFVGDIYLLHDEPQAIGTTLELDSAYIDFVTETALSKSSRHQAVAQRILNEIDSDKVLASPTETEKTFNQLGDQLFSSGIEIDQTKVTENVANIHSLESTQKIADQKSIQRKILSAVECDKGIEVDQKATQRKILSAVEDDKKFFHQRKNFSPGGKLIDFGANTPKNRENRENFFPSRVCSSYCSSSDTKELLTSACARDEDVEKFSEANDTNPGFSPKTLTSDDLGDLREQYVDPVEARVEIEWQQIASEVKYYIPEYADPLIRKYVVELFINRQRQIKAYPRILADLTTKQRHDVLFQLLSKAACDFHGYSEQKLIKPIAFLRSLCKKAQSNQLNLDEIASQLQEAVKRQSPPLVFDSQKKIQRSIEMMTICSDEYGA